MGRGKREHGGEEPQKREAERLPGQTSGRGQDLTVGGSQGSGKGVEALGAVGLQEPGEGPSTCGPSKMA